MKTTVFIATSLDGYIARPDGGLDWLPDGEGELEDHGYSALMDSIDVLVMGRNTYDVVRSFGDWPYGDKPVAVLTTRELVSPANANVRAIGGSPGEVIASLADDGAQHLYIDGGKVVQAFLREGLVDEMIITTIPILIGQGISLFGPLDADIRLEHLTTQSFKGGLTQSHYRVL